MNSDRQSIPTALCSVPKIFITIALLYVSVHFAFADGRSESVAKAECMKRAVDAGYTVNNLHASKEITSKLAKRCLSVLEVEQVGWFHFIEMVFVDTCGFRFSSAVLLGKTNLSNSALLQGSADYEANLAMDKHPFFIGLNRARTYYYAREKAELWKPTRQTCEDIMLDFGPNGVRFPGLLER